MPGTIFLVTGLPYSGQKTLLAKLAEKLQDSPSFSILEPSISAEELRTHPSQTILSEDDFKQHTDAGTLFCSWKFESSAGYLQQTVVDALSKTLKVVLRIPRERLADAEKKALALEGGVDVKVINLQASVETVTKRAALAEDKFNDKNFAKRLKGIPEAKGNDLTVVENEGTEEEGLEELLKALAFDPLLDLPPTASDDSELNLATCSPQEYLSAMLYPYLMPALERLSIERPADPVEFLALYLQQSSSTYQKRVEELTREKILRTRLRAELAHEYAVVGRI